MKYDKRTQDILFQGDVHIASCLILTTPSDLMRFC